MSTARGRAAEQAAAHYLRAQGYTIVAQNWLTRWCEIDIIVEKQQIHYFVEVKYRASLQYGSGLDYITTKKLQQMQFAAEFWMAQHSFLGQGILAAIEVSGENLHVAELVIID